MADLFGSRGSLFGSTTGGGLSSGPPGRRPLTLQQIQELRRQLAQIELAKQPKRSNDNTDYSWRNTFGIYDVGGKAIGQIVGSLVSAPAGIWALGTSAGHDMAKATGAAASLFGYTPPEQSFAGRVQADSWQGDDIGKAVVQQTYEDFRHPLRNPGYLAMDVASLGTFGATTGVRLVNATRKYGEMAAAYRAQQALPEVKFREPPDQPGPSGPPRPPNPILPPVLGAQTPIPASGTVSMTVPFQQQLLAQTTLHRPMPPQQFAEAAPKSSAVLDAPDRGPVEMTAPKNTPGFTAPRGGVPEYGKPMPVSEEATARIIDKPPPELDITVEDLNQVHVLEDRWQNPKHEASRVEFHPNSIRMFERDPVTGVEKESAFRAIRVDNLMGGQSAYRPTDVIPRGFTGKTRPQLGSVPGKPLAQATADYRRLTGSVARLQYALEKAEGGDLTNAAKALRSEADEADKAAARVDKLMDSFKERTKRAQREAKVPEGARNFDVEARKASIAKGRKEVGPGQRKLKAAKTAEAERLREIADLLDSRVAGIDRAAAKAIETRLNGAVEKLAAFNETRQTLTSEVHPHLGPASETTPSLARGLPKQPIWKIYENGKPLRGVSEREGGWGGGDVMITGKTPTEAAANAWAQLKRTEAEREWLAAHPQYKLKDTSTLIYGGKDIKEALSFRRTSGKRFREKMGRRDKAIDRIAEKAAKKVGAAKAAQLETDVDLAFEEYMQAKEKTRAKQQARKKRAAMDPVGQFLEDYRGFTEAKAAKETARAKAIEKPAPATAAEAAKEAAAAPKAVELAEAESPAPPAAAVEGAPQAQKPPPPEKPVGEPLEPSQASALPKQTAPVEELPNVTDDLDGFKDAADAGKPMIDSTGKTWDRETIDAEVQKLYDEGDPERPNAPDDEHLMYAEATVAHKLRMLSVANTAKQHLAENPELDAIKAPTKEEIDTVIKATRIEQPKTPREQYRNPRATSDDLRSRGLSPRQLRISIKHLRAAGIARNSLNEFQKLSGALWTEFKALHEATPEPSNSDKVRAMRAAGMTEAEIKKMFKYWETPDEGPPKIGGGQDITRRDIVKETIDAFFKNPNKAPGTLAMEYTRQVKQTVEKPLVDATGKQIIDPYSGEPKFERITELKDETRTADVPLNRSPLWRAFQKWQYEQLKKRPTSRVRALSFRTLPQKVEFEIKQNTRMVKGMIELGWLSDPKKLNELKEIAKTRPLRLTDVIDATNAYLVSAVLHMKPAYLLPNLLGQLLFMSIHHHLNPISIARSVQQQHALRKLAKTDAEWALVDMVVRSGMEGGIMREVGGIDTDIQMASKGDVLKKPGRAYVVGARRAHQVAQSGFRIPGTKRRVPGYGSLLDTPFRWNAFLHEAHMKGYKNAEDIKAMVLSEEGTKEYKDYVEIARRANKAMVDYGRLGKHEKQIIRRILFIYPWVKGSTMYTGHFFAEHPLQAMGAVAAGRYAQQRNEEILPDVPSYAQGFIPVGSRNVPGVGKVPTVINPNAFSPFGSSADVLGALHGIVTGRPNKSEELTGFLNPAGRAAWAAIGRSDPFTKKDYPSSMNFFDILGAQAAQAAAPYQYYERLKRAGEIEKDPELAKDILFPMNKREATGRYLFGVTPYAINPDEAASRAEEEDLATRSPGERALARGQHTIDAFNKTYGGKMPDRLRSALEIDAQREAAQKDLKSELGHDLSALERLAADMRVAVSTGKIDEQRANQILQRAAEMNDNQVDVLRQNIAENIFDRPVIAYAKKRAEKMGIEVPAGA